MRLHRPLRVHSLMVTLLALIVLGCYDAPTPDTYTQTRTPWGDPDLQGIWSSGYIETPLERPDKHGGREFLTVDEVRAELERLEAQQDHSTGAPKRPVVRRGDTGTYNTVFSGRGRDVIRTRRTSLVIDPPDGRIPWQPGMREKVAAEMQLGATRRGASLREDNSPPRPRRRGHAVAEASQIHLGARLSHARTRLRRGAEHFSRLPLMSATPRRQCCREIGI